MDMDKAPLNRAHQLERKAEKLNRQKKLDECIQCHTEAVELFKQCLKVGDNKSAHESIQLQKEWNERQIRTLHLKKAYLERIEKEKKASRISQSSKHSQKEAVENLEAKIFRNFETHDSLICYLAQRGIIDNPDKQYQSTIEETDEKDGSPFIVGNKHPKDDSTVIEELKELSGQLRESVQGNLDRLPGLLIQLDVRKKQNERLIERIKNLELKNLNKEGLLIQLDDRNKEIDQLKAHIKELESGKSDKEGSTKDNPEATAESSGASSLTLVATAFPELDLEVTELTALPPLEPLTVPEIDIAAFKQFRMPKVSSKLLCREK